MAFIVDENLERYAEAHTSPVAPLFHELRRETFAHMSAPQMQVGPVEGTFLKLLVRLSRARTVVEIGMFTGYSALMLAEALPEGGKLITCDIDERAREMAQRFFARSPHGKKIEIRMGPALATLATLPGPIDLAFVDADKGNYPAYYERCVELLRPGGLLVADNVLWSGRVLDPKDDDTRAIHTFNERVASDPRVEVVMLTVRDGMSLVVKK